MMTTAHGVETSVTVNKSPIQYYTHPDDHRTFLLHDSWVKIIYHD